MRPIPSDLETAPEFCGVASPDLRIEMKVQVATAYYGGGVEGGVSDNITPFRASAIRGALRWFWRATRGGAYAGYRELKEREDAIWGATDQASPIQVEVYDAVLGTPVLARRRENDRNVFEQPAYALFPAQSDVVRTIHKGGRFTLCLRFPRTKLYGGSNKHRIALGDEVDAALRAWFSFGGVGARTRRGLGALYCSEYSGLDRWLSAADLMGDGGVKDWSTLKGARVVLGQRPLTVQAAWEEAVGILQHFRQDRFQPRGRSRWPEPDAIRRLRKQRAAHHGEDMTRDDIYPRAALGLPIIFHFKTPGDPSPDNTLQIDKDTDRWASPVIAKPLVISATQAVPMLVALQSKMPDRLLLRQANKGTDTPVSAGNWDVLSSLLAKAAKEWNAPVYGL